MSYYSSIGGTTSWIAPTMAALVAQTTSKKKLLSPNPSTNERAAQVDPPVLYQLRRLDKSSPHFHERLSNILRGNDYRAALHRSPRDEIEWLIEYLDTILRETPDHANPIFQESLQELELITRYKGMLPKSCALSESLVGSVYEATYNGSKVRIRRIRMRGGGKPQGEAVNMIQMVAVRSKSLIHPNIVPFLGVTMDPLEFISDWMPGGDLATYVASHPEADKVSLLVDVAEGMNYLHSYNIIHGDLNGSNILMDATGHARITDFGLVVITHNGAPVPGHWDLYWPGFRWIALEVLRGWASYNRETDVFSFAGVMIEVFTGAGPFSDRGPLAALSAIADGERPPRPTDPVVTDRLWELIQQCWNKETKLRPCMLHVLCNLRYGLPPWKCLIDPSLTPGDQISMLTAIFSSNHEVEAIKNLGGDDAQTLIDAVDQMLDSLPPWIQKKCVGVMRKICGRQALIPRSVQIQLCCDRSGTPLYQGGYADVWKAEYGGREIALKVLRVFSVSDVEKITSRFCKEVVAWRTLRHPNILSLLGVTMDNSFFSMATEWMRNGNINEYIKSNPDANRFELLKDVANGLIYMHGQAMVHGDLKGANVLIDEDGHARLADFGLLTFVSDPTNVAAPTTAASGGTTRWMSPELLHPEQFGLKESRPTKESDYYALGMVILEVLSGQSPFARYKEFIVMRKVIEGERPERPKEGQFTDALWRIVEQCWASQPKNRASAESVLECLEKVSTGWLPSPLREKGDFPTGYGYAGQ